MKSRSGEGSIDLAAQADGDSLKVEQDHHSYRKISATYIFPSRAASPGSKIQRCPKGISQRRSSLEMAQRKCSTAMNSTTPDRIPIGFHAGGGKLLLRRRCGCLAGDFT
ncbi:hypothetical protein AK812_SmicGene24338 [Symbiodinium microadriaticum]|uniref:Uncharacterized protein n=1 Tax=Symbiodinium microadriaticum TaxID=2951 RepID=A0A1Q9DET3_SYMMI|nr:hypothetical protein AK812_SmicGene24338 [Symbiodinium microadriaticum]